MGSRVSVTLTGSVERVTFENETTGFRVVRLSDVVGAGTRSKVTIVGRYSFVGPGTTVRVTGEFETDPKHGERFSVESLLVVTPETLEGVRSFLASGRVRGIGPKTAERIVAYFGKETLRILDTASHRLLEVPGLGAKKVAEIRQSYAEEQAATNLQVLLASLGESSGLAFRLIEEFGPRAQEMLEQEPYKLAERMRGVGFQTADRLAMRQGTKKTHPDRLRAGIQHALTQLSDDGHTAVTERELLDRSAELLGVETPLIAIELDALWAQEKIVRDGDFLQLRRLAEDERIIARELERLSRAPVSRIEEPEKVLAVFEESRGLRLSDEQRTAVLACLAAKVTIVTGGPGVGKTTIVAATLALSRAAKLECVLAAPTGRAAKRLAEATSSRATTIHRLLEIDPKTFTFRRGAEMPLDADLVLVDEVSMVDVPLMASLLMAVPTRARLVLVGDRDQLPSVGPGAVLRDLLLSEKFATAALRTVYRQAEGSGIVDGARQVLAGTVPRGARPGEPLSEFYVVTATDASRAKNLVLELVAERIPGRFGIPARDVQVLTPMHRGELGTESLNAALRARLLAAPEDTRFAPGDRVLQLRNNYDLDVYNGDLGTVASVAEGRVVVAFDAPEGDRIVEIEGKRLADLGLAYAISVHKSQGSEFPAVVIPLSSSHYLMLHRNLLYTAITRAKKLCVLVVEPKALALAVSEFRKESRRTRLLARLLETQPDVSTPTLLIDR